MKKLILIVFIFLIIGAVSAHDDLNCTGDDILKDTEYNSNIDDDDEMLVIEENEDIPIEVNVDENYSLNVYIDKHSSPSNEESVNVDYDQLDIPTSVIINGEETPLDLGKHSIVYEFKFTNTTSLYKPEAYISDSGVYFNFNFVRNIKTPQNSIYRFTSQFNIIESIEPTTTTFNLDEINITYSDSLSFSVKGMRYSKVDLYLDDEFFDSFDIDENPYEDEINTKNLAKGSYNLVCILESNNVYAEYNVKADTSNSMINVKFTKSKNVHTPNKYITIINTTLNVCDSPELNPIYVSAPPVNITYTRSIPIRFEGEESGNLEVYIDGKKVYNNSVLLTWENICYIPTKDADGNYFDVGSHDISFEFVFSDKYVSFKPRIYWYDNALIFDFLDSKDSGAFLNDKYIVNTKLNIINENAQFIPIDSQAVVSIVHTDDIKLEIDSIPYSYNLTVFVDDVEIYDSYTRSEKINIKTFLERTSIDETNERDIQTGTHSIRFEFKALFVYDVDVEFADKTLYFKFNPVDSTVYQDGVYYQFNTSLIVKEKKKTVHILNVKNHTYFDDTEFIVKMDEYKPEDDDDWDNDGEEWAIGTQDVGIIVSDENGIVYIEDDLINVFKSEQWNYEFENEKLPKAGTYTMKIVNLADNTYDTASFEVKKANRSFKTKYTADDFNVQFTLDFSSCEGDLNGPCKITLDNQEKVINVKKSLSQSTAEVLFKDIDPGVYTATFTLKGNEIYNDVTLKSKVTVKKETPTISHQETDGNKIKLTIDISKSKTDGVLIASAGGEQKKFTIDKNTKHLTIEFDDLKSGNYDVEIYFEGNERYTSKKLTVPLEITSHSEQPDPQPTEPVEEEVEDEGEGLGNNGGGTGTGSGNSSVPGSGNSNVPGNANSNASGSGISNVAGNGNSNASNSENSNVTSNENYPNTGEKSATAKGSSGDVGSEGSGQDNGVKSYEITKVINPENANTLLIFILIALVLLFLSFIYERRDNDEEEY